MTGEWDFVAIVRVRRGRHHTLDQPLPMTDRDDVPLARGIARRLVGDEDRRRRRALGGAVRLEEPSRELRTGPTGIVEAVRAAGELELVTPEAREQLAKSKRGHAQQGVGLLLLGAARRDRDCKGLAQLAEPGS